MRLNHVWVPVICLASAIALAQETAGAQQSVQVATAPSLITLLRCNAGLAAHEADLFLGFGQSRRSSSIPGDRGRQNWGPDRDSSRH